MTPISKLRAAMSRENVVQLARINAARLGDRQTDELIGMVRMDLADGVLEQFEAEFLLQWLHANEHARTTWPGLVIYARLCKALEDEALDADEEAELLALLAQAIGSPNPEEAQATRLPLTHPAPAVEFAGRRFCFTGRFYTGSRAQCMQLVIERGGDATDRLTSDVDYLVIGQNGSLDWLHSTHGRKIKAALDFNEKGRRIAIVGEEHWAKRL